MTETTVTIGSTEGFRAWLSLKGFSQDTLRAYVGDVRSFFEENNLAELDPTELEMLTGQWLNRMRRVWAARTTQRKMTSMRKYAEYLGTKDFLEDYRLPRAARQDPKPLDGGVEDIERMLAACRSDVERALIAMLGLCGMRISEALARTPYEFDLKNKLIKIKQGKGSKDRVVPLSDMAYENICTLVQQGWLDNWDYLITFSNRTARKRVTEIARRAGLPHVASHMLRATFATEAYNNSGNDIRAVQELLGHASITTTQMYVGTSMDAMRTAANFTSRPPVGDPNIPSYLKDAP
jgi:integrase/recombinase XerD